MGKLATMMSLTKLAVFAAVMPKLGLGADASLPACPKKDATHKSPEGMVDVVHLDFNTEVRTAEPLKVVWVAQDGKEADLITFSSTDPHRVQSAKDHVFRIYQDELLVKEFVAGSEDPQDVKVEACKDMKIAPPPKTDEL